MPSLGKKIFHVCMIAIIIVGILTVSAVLILRYQVIGETNLPFVLSKITIISSTGGKNSEDINNKWNISVEQNNDIYLYIAKNDRFGKTKIIENVTIENFSIQNNNEFTTKIYMPSSSAVDMFNNSEETTSNKITYMGDLQSDLKNLKISNQGGIVAFRFTNQNVGNYISNEVQEINYNELLKLCSVSEENIKAKVTFDLNIKLTDGKEYKSTISLDVPVENIIDLGTTNKEITDVSEFIFKRVEK